MTDAWFGAPLRRLHPMDEAEATARAKEFGIIAAERGFPDLADRMARGGDAAAFLGSVFTLSPYLRDLLFRRPKILVGLGDQPADARLGRIIADIGLLPADASLTETALMTALRRAKGEAHALIALGDLAAPDMAPVTVARLSDLADACVRAAVRFLLADAHRQGKLRLPDPGDPERKSGLIVLGMGKLGARELNFSSDIDLIVFFEPEAAAVVDPQEATDTFSRLVRRLVRILQDRTADGYVFRTDLRLRPDPGSMPLAIPVEAALNYYEGRGQNWERAAMIKARAVAGDVAAGEGVLRELQPYVWRKYMDYAAIADVHSIKRQIHAHRGHGEIAVRGHNVKLGRGGIREIEFFVQTQQLIAGGRYPELRGRETVAMLAELAERRWITFEASRSLTAEYWFLRRVEHAIQMVADEQTHLLPEDDEGLDRIARMLGFDGCESFSAVLRASLQTVERHYAALFESAPQLSAGIGNLVFTGDVDDPDTLATLRELGFERPSDICRVIRTWHFGRYRATQSAEARERLTELTPALLEAFGATRRADEALLRFDALVAGLPAGIQLFALLQSNPSLLQLLATIMSAAPRLADIITRRPHVFDGLLDPSLIAELPTKLYLGDRLKTFLDGSRLHEETLDRLRIFVAEQKFLIGIRLLTGAIDAARAGRAFSALADLAIGAALDAVTGEFERRHGRVEAGRVALLGMGKLGSRELTAGSDVDLILLYDHHEEASASDGERPLAPSLYFTRLTQRLIAAVSAPTAEGVLYELDLRLRPSGNQGPVATHIDAFRKYQRGEAETWEHMALTRARVIAGDAGLAGDVEAELSALTGSALAADVRRDAREMRARIAEAKPPANAWDVKLIPGGLIDLEFIAQVALLTGNTGGAARTTSTAEALASLQQPFASDETRRRLAEAHGLYSGLAQAMRLCLTERFEPGTAPPGLTDFLLRVTGLPDLRLVEAEIGETSAAVQAAFRRLIG